MKTNAFIFARGGSKGVPRKNLQLLGNITLLEHAIQTAKNLKSLYKIFVSSDDEEILAIARQNNVELIRRPDIFATDKANEWDAWRHAVEYVEKEFGSFDRFLSLPTTSPLRNLEDVRNCLDAFTSGVDVVVTATNSQRSPYFNIIKMEDDDFCNVVLPMPGIHGRQQTPKTYDLTTVAYVTTPSFIKSNSGIFSGKVKAVLVSQESALDIDTELDLRIVRALYDERNV